MRFRSHSFENRTTNTSLFSGTFVALCAVLLHVSCSTPLLWSETRARFVVPAPVKVHVEPVLVRSLPAFAARFEMRHYICSHASAFACAGFGQVFVSITETPALVRTNKRCVGPENRKDAFPFGTPFSIIVQIERSYQSSCTPRGYIMLFLTSKKM